MRIRKKYRYTCEHCGRLCENSGYIQKINGITVCRKHYTQYNKYGKFLDSNPRTTRDPNEIRIVDGIAYMDLYDVYSNVIATTMFDAEDVEKVKKYKWCLANNYISATVSRGKGLFFGRYILDIKDHTLFTDYINHDTLDNRKCNLRIATRTEDKINSNFTKAISGFKGVHYHNTYKKWCASIKYKYIQIHLGCYEDINEAKFARLTAEEILHAEFAIKREKPVIDKERVEDIQKFVRSRIDKYILGL